MKGVEGAEEGEAGAGVALGGGGVGPRGGVDDYGCGTRTGRRCAGCSEVRVRACRVMSILVLVLVVVAAATELDSRR